MSDLWSGVSQRIDSYLGFYVGWLLLVGCSGVRLFGARIHLGTLNGYVPCYHMCNHSFDVILIRYCNLS